MQTVFSIDPDLQAVAEFMQHTLPAGKLVTIAENLPQVARLLWSKFPQEPVVGASLTESAITSDLRQVSSVCGPALAYADGGSGAGVDSPISK